MSTTINHSVSAVALAHDRPWTPWNGRHSEPIASATHTVDTAPYRHGVRKAFDELFAQLDEQNSTIAALLVAPSGRR